MSKHLKALILVPLLLVLAAGKVWSAVTAYDVRAQLSQSGRTAAAVITAKAEWLQTYEVQYRFRDRKGNEWRGSQSVDRSVFGSLSVGQTEIVRYDPFNPALSAIDVDRLSGHALEAFLYALLMLGASGLLVLVTIRRRFGNAVAPTVVPGLPAAQPA